MGVQHVLDDWSLANCKIPSLYGLMFFKTPNRFDSVKFIARSVKFKVASQWLIAWIGIGQEFSIKEKIMCTIRFRLGDILWRIFTWCVWLNETFVKKGIWCNFLTVQIPDTSGTVWHCETSFAVSLSLYTFWRKDAHIAANQKMCCVCFEIFDTLLARRGKRKVEPNSNRRWGMGVL